MPTLEVEIRSESKPNALRRQGQIPAIVYGPTIENRSVAVGRKDLEELFGDITRSSKVDLSITDGDKREEFDVFVKSIQYDAITDDPVHVDFYHPDAGRAIRLHIPIKIVGEAAGVKSGGVLNVLCDTVRVYGLPKDMPTLVTIDVSDLELGEAVRVGDVDFGEVQPFLSPEEVVITIMAPRSEEEEEAILAMPEEEEVLEGLEEGEGMLEEAEEALEGDEEAAEEEQQEQQEEQPQKEEQ